MKAGPKNNILYIMLFAIFMALLSVIMPGTIFIFTVFSIISIILWKVSPPEEKRFIVWLFALSFLMRSMATVLVHAVQYLRDYQGFVFGDDRLFTLKAWQLGLKWQGDYYGTLLDRYGYGVNLYTYFLALFYKIFGFNYLSSKLISCLIGGAVPVLIYKISRTMFSFKTSRIASYMVTFWPSLIFWSIANLKDPFILFFNCFGFYFIVSKLRKGYIIPKLFLLAIMISPLLGLQKLFFYLVLFCAVTFIVISILMRFKKTIILKMIAILLIGVVAAGPFLLKRYESKIVKTIKFIETYNRSLFFAGNSGYYLYDAKLFDEADKIKGIPYLVILKAYLKGIVYFLFTPFPWMISSLRQLAAYPQVILWYIFFPFALSGIVKAFKMKKGREALPLVLYVVIGVSIMAFLEGNMGAAFRHRDYFLPIIFVFSAFGISLLFKEE